MLKNLTIRTKTALGFGLILLVMATVVTFSIRGLQSSSDSFQTYRRLARSSVLSGRVQANMLMASKAAKSFLRSRDDRQLEIYNERFENARKFALEEQATLVDPHRCQLSGRLVSQLDRYQQANQDVFQLMRRRDAILQDTLNPQGLKMRENLTKIMVSAYRDEDPEAAYLSGRALERVLLGRLYMFKFLEDNREADAERVRSELGSGFRQDFDQMVFAIDDPVRKDLLQEFSTARDAYLAAFEELVLTIQKRNTLIAQEVEPLDQSIADVSEQIKLSLKADQDKLGPSVQASNTATIGRVLVGSTVAVVLSMLIAWFFVRTIATSIAALGQSEAETERLSREITLREETERKLASALSEVERVNFLSDIALEQTHCGYWHVDYSDPDYYYQSERAATILGEPIKPDGRYHLQREWFDRLLEANPGTAEETSERYQGAIDGRYENYESTYAYKRPVDGEVVWVHALGKIVRDDDGKIRHMYGVYQDVTRQKQAEQAVVAAEQRSRSLLESAPDGMMIADDQGRIVIVNAQFESLFGYAKDEIVGQFVEVLLPDRFREKHVGQRTSFFGTPSVRNMGSGMEMFALRKDSTEFPVEISLSPLQTDEGMLVSSSIRDISQRKRSEEAMRKSEEQFRTLVGNIPGVVYRCLPRHPWTMLFISDGIEVLSGYAASDFLKLLDFGIVRTTIGPDQTVTTAGQLKGTPTSLSPEVVQGEQASFASDIYGLGCVAYWLLSGRHVFEAPTLTALLMRHVTQPVTPRSKQRSDVPSELEELVLSCLAKNPADRPTNAFELGERLAAVPFDEPWDNRHAETWWNENMPAASGDAPTECCLRQLISVRVIRDDLTEEFQSVRENRPP